MLEVLKLSSPQDVLRTSATCRSWKRVCSSQELWQAFSDMLQLRTCLDALSFKLEFRTAYCLAETEGADTRIYNCLSEGWRTVHHLNLPFGLTSACTWLPSGDLFVCGGFEPCIATAALVEVETGKIRELPSMNQARGLHSVVAYGVCVYVFSGYDGAVVRSCEKLDLEQGLWTQLPDSPDGAVNSGACLLNESIYQCGTEFNTLLAFRLLTQQFQPTGIKVPTQGAVRSCVAVGGEVLILSTEEVRRWSEGKQVSVQRVRALCGGWWGCMRPICVQGRVCVLSDCRRLQVFCLESQQCRTHAIPEAN